MATPPLATKSCEGSAPKARRLEVAEGVEASVGRCYNNKLARLPYWPLGARPTPSLQPGFLTVSDAVHGYAVPDRPQNRNRTSE